MQTTIFLAWKVHCSQRELYSLLTTPFDYSQAFDRALKDVVKSLPNRPSKETADEVVCHLMLDIIPHAK
jgi:hypothetical protein